MLKLDTEKLIAVVENELRDMQKMCAISKSETVIGEIGGMVVTISVLNKEEADYTFSGDWTNLAILKESGDE